MKQLLIFAPLTVLLLALSSARAETWAPTTGNGFWGDTAAWVETTVPNAVGATASFPAPTGTRTVSLGGTGSTCPSNVCNFTVGSISFINSGSLTTTIRNGSNIADPAVLIFDAAGSGPATISATGTTTNQSLITATMVFNDSVTVTTDTGGNATAGQLSLTGDITGSGGLTKEGAGTLTMAFISGSSGQIKGYTGPTVVNNGRLRLSQGGAPNATSSVTVNSGAQILLITGVAGTNTGIYTFGSSPSTVITLNGTGLAANPGAIRLETANAAPTQITNLISLATTSAFNINGPANVIELNNSVSGAGGLIVNSLANAGDTGTLKLDAANSYLGGTTVNLGTLLLNNAAATLGSGNVRVEGAAAGSAGQLVIPAGVTNAIADSATLTLTGGGTAGVADQGYVSLDSNDTVGGLVLGGVTQAPGTYGSTSSTATNQNDEYFSGAGVLTVAAPTLLGDFNNDGKVDAGDYVTWRKNNGTNNALANDNGLGTPVGTAHYNLWRAHFGSPPGSGAGGLTSGAVPEASTASLLLIMALLVGPWRRFGNNRRDLVNRL